MSKGFKANESDKCNYYKFENGLCIIICFYVDDMFIFRSNFHIINCIKSIMCANFDMKDLEEANVILGIKITRFEKGICLDQSHYIEKVLKKYNYFDRKITCTPYDLSVKLFKNTEDTVNQSEYYCVGLLANLV